MYVEAIFRPAGLQTTRIYPDQARKLVGKALDGVAFNPLLFNRDASGKTINVLCGEFMQEGRWAMPPAVVFDGGMGFIRMFGIGQAGIEAVEAEAPKVFGALMRLHGVTAVQMNKGEVTIRPTGYAVPHRIRLLVVGKQPGIRYTDAISDARICAAIKRQVVNGMLGQCALLGGNMEKDIPRDEDIDLLEGEPTKAVAIDRGLPVSAYRNVVIAMPVRLSGPWMAGHLRARGYGMIRAVDPTRERDVGAVA